MRRPLLLICLIAFVPLISSADVPLSVAISSVPPDRGYNQTTDRFDQRYIQGSALLTVDACRGLRTLRRKPNTFHPMVANPRLNVILPPPNVVAWRWTYTSGSKSFSKQTPIIKNVQALANDGHDVLLVSDASSACRTELEVEAGKPYSVQVTLISSTGPIESSSLKSGHIRNATLVVSIGDSYASGEGQPDRAAGLGDNANSVCHEHTTKSLENDTKPKVFLPALWRLRERGHRSLSSSHALAVKALESTHAPLTFISLAASGARLEGITGQLIRLHKMIPAHAIDVLLVSAGGNSVGFSKLLRGAASGTYDAATIRKLFNHLLTSPDPSSCDVVEMVNFSTTYTPACKMLKSIAGNPPRSFDAKLEDLEMHIREVAPKNTLWIGYPLSFFDDANGAPSVNCGVFRTGRGVLAIGDTQGYGVDGAERRAIKESANRLNEHVQKFAREHGIKFVDLRLTFAAHGYCAGTGVVPYFVGAEESCYTQGDFEGTMHPNSAGANATAREIAELIVQVVPVPIGPSGQGPEQPTGQEIQQGSRK